MKTYSKNSIVRKPMMYGGMSKQKMNYGGTPNIMGNAMAAGMKRDKMAKTTPMMMYGGKAKKK